MKSIPIHNLQEKTMPIQFEVMPWRKDISRYDATEPHRHEYYEILIFLKGGGKHEIDFHNYPIKSHSLHFISSNQVHEVRRSPKSDGFSILFTADFIGQNRVLTLFSFFQTGAFPVLNLFPKQFKELKFLLQDIHKEYFDESNRNPEILRSLLLTLLLKANRLYNELVTDSEIIHANDFTSQFKQLVEDHYQEHWRAGDYANALNLTATHLNTLCKQHFSKTTEAIIQNRVIIEIKRLLSYTDKSIKEICFDLNFEDPAYFTRFFKKKAGVTPVEYRNIIKA